MMFRKLYWVTELVHTDGRSQVTGIFTSIPDLINRGLKRSEVRNVRLTLSKLDSSEPPIGVWTARDFAQIEDGLAEFVRTDEFSADHCRALVNFLSGDLVGSR